jgi:putative oxidoreductase
MKQLSRRRIGWGLFLLRFLVGWVFLSEGIQKFLFPAALGAGRFQKIGIPWPQFTGPFVGVTEIACGSLLILGLFSSLAVWPLLIDILVAIATTKVPMLLKQGYWAAMHEGRADFCMLMGLIAIALLGAGTVSLDERRRSQ